MKKINLILLLIVGAIFGMRSDYEAGAIIISIDPDLETTCIINQDGILETGLEEVDALNREFGANYGRYITDVRKMNEKYQKKVWYARNDYKFSFSNKNIDVDEICKRYEELDMVNACTPNYFEPYLVEPYNKVTPNDSLYRRQWHLDRINAPETWNFSTGDSSITVSCFEAIDWQHKDIGPVVWNNLGEDANGNGYTIYFDLGTDQWEFDPGDLNGVDDDENGFEDDLIGYDFLDEACDYPSIHPDDDCDEQDNNPTDQVGLMGHGTHVSGTMVLSSNDRYGLASVGWDTRIMCLRADFTTLVGGVIHGAHDGVAQIAAFDYAVMMGLDVYCLSYGGYSYSSVISRRLQIVHNANNGFIAGAAGNEDTDESSFPCAYEGVIGVASSNEYDRKSDFSNYSATYVDITAPGSNIWSTMPRNIPDGYWQSASGTSMATPVVAGVAAIMKSVYPDLPVDMIEYMMISTADPMPDEPMFEDGLLGSGIVNMYKALYFETFPLLDLDTIEVVTEPGDDNGRIDIGETGYIRFEYTADPEWQATGDLTISLRTRDSGITILDSDINIGSFDAGASFDNNSNLLSFTPDESFDDGHRVLFIVKVESSTGYFREDTVSAVIGWPNLLIWDHDGNSYSEEFIFESFDWGRLSYEYFDYDNSDILTAENLISRHKTIFFVNGNNSEEPITPEEIALFESFLDEATPSNPRNLWIGGQFLADDPQFTDFLNNYLKTVHTIDSVAFNWGMTVVGNIDDTIVSDLSLNAALPSGGFSPQFSVGGCELVEGTEGGYNSFLYNASAPDTVYCATRYDSGSYRTFFTEFSIPNLGSTNPTGNTRFDLIEAILTWFGIEVRDIEEKRPSNTPDEISVPKAYPNPFNSAVSIDFEVKYDSNIEISIYDLSGKRIATPLKDRLLSGNHTITWKPDYSIPSGIYLYHIAGKDFNHSSRLLYIK